MPVRRPQALFASLLAAAACLAGSTTASAEAVTPVTVISDSVLTSILWYPQNLGVLGQGFDLDMEVAIGRRLEGVSAPFNGSSAPTVVDLIPTIPIHPTVIVEMGYNDDPATFRAQADQVIDLLLARGATHIIWPTLSESKPEYASMNRDLVALLIAHPQLTLADWSGVSGTHPEWFQTDHLHLMPAGGGGMATLLHAALVSSLGNGTTVTLPQARQGRRFSTLLQAPAGGPVSWRIVAGSLPRGLQLLASGVVAGVPKASGTFAADALVETTDDVIAHVTVTIAVAKRMTVVKRHKKRAR